MANCSVILTQGSTTLEIDAQKIDEDVTKNWRINPIPSTFGNRHEDALTVAASATDTTITVGSGSSFSEYDRITITGDDASGDAHMDVSTITGIAGNVLTLSKGLTYGYVIGSKVVRGTRVISLDFNQTVQSVTITGMLVGTSTTEARTLRNTLWDMAVGGGSVEVEYDGKSQADMGITKLNIVRVPEDTDIPQVYNVIVNMTNTSVEQGAIS